MEIASHLRCDSRTVCSQCSIYLWKPSTDPKVYYFCPTCNNDILCDRGLIQQFEYSEELLAERSRHLCLICRTEVVEKQWPRPTGKRLDMIS